MRIHVLFGMFVPLHRRFVEWNRVTGCDRFAFTVALTIDEERRARARTTDEKHGMSLAGRNTSWLRNPSISQFTGEKTSLRELSGFKTFREGMTFALMLRIVEHEEAMRS